jgi:lipoprotein-releasing system permease protein
LSFHSPTAILDGMPFSLFLALRYLKPKRAAVSVITLFCVIGVMLGVGALIVVISVMNGFQEKIREQLLALEPHIVAIQHSGPAAEEDVPPENWRTVAARLRALDRDVVNVTAVIEVPAMLELVNRLGEKFVDPVQLTAVDVSTTDLGTRLDIERGRFDLDGDYAVISQQLADQWALQVGDTITVQSFRNAEEAYKVIDKWEKTPKEDPTRDELTWQQFGQTNTDARTAFFAGLKAGRGEADKWFEEMKQIVQPSELTVTGIFATRQRAPIFVPLHIGAEMMVKGDAIDYLGVTTPDALEVGRFREVVDRAVPAAWTTDTWRERHREYFDAVESERGMMYVLLLLIMIVAAFCIIVTLATVAIHKRKEIGVIRSLGARMGQIIGIFVQQGTIVGALGTLLGLGGGLWFLAERMAVKKFVQVITGVEILDPGVYGVSEIPCDVRSGDVLVICAIALAVSTIAGVIPALMAAWQDPAKALRSE